MSNGRVTWGAIRRRVANERRARRLAARAARDLTPPPPSAFAAFGAGSVIGTPGRVTTPEVIHIGEGVLIHEHSWISVVEMVPGYRPKLSIGDGTHIGRLCHIACVGEIEIGSEVLMAERVFIGDTYHGYEDPEVPIIRQPMAPPSKVTIGRGSFIGVGAVILRGVSIGEQAYVGGGSVVTQDVPPRTVVVGNPARPVRRYDVATGRWEPIS